MLIARDHKGLLIVLGPENIARMRNGDPATIPDLGITICFEEMKPEKLAEILKSDPRKYLTRGWQNHPDDYRIPKKM